MGSVGSLRAAGPTRSRTNNGLSCGSNPWNGLWHVPAAARSAVCQRADGRTLRQGRQPLHGRCSV